MRRRRHHRSRVTSHRSRVTDYRSQVTTSNRQNTIRNAPNSFALNKDSKSNRQKFGSRNLPEKARIAPVNRRIPIAAALTIVCAACLFAQRPRHRAAKAPLPPPDATAALPPTTLEAIGDNNLGVALMDLGNFSDALAHFQSA